MLLYHIIQRMHRHILYIVYVVIITEWNKNYSESEFGHKINLSTIINLGFITRPRMECEIMGLPVGNVPSCEIKYVFIYTYVY